MIDDAVRERVEIQFERMEMDINILKHDIDEEAKRLAADDSDEEVRDRDLKQVHPKLIAINKADAKQFPKMNKELPVANDLEKQEESKLPIVFHEREIMDCIESNTVSIVCGETGSGKSTQIPQFILQNHRANPWKYRSSVPT